MSTGQGKLVILISAILYKHYLNETLEEGKRSVLFIVDETLANLDKGTSSKVCKVIKEEFKDSIVLSVDHNWESSKDFYDCAVDLSEYVSKSYEVDLTGEILELKDFSFCSIL